MRVCAAASRTRFRKCRNVTEVLGPCERYRIDTVLDHDMAPGWESGDPESKCAGEVVDLLAGTARLIQPYCWASSASYPPRST
jgi:hypothetical protein